MWCLYILSSAWTLMYVRMYEGRNVPLASIMKSYNCMLYKYMYVYTHLPHTMHICMYALYVDTTISVEISDTVGVLITLISVINTPQCQILHCIFYSVHDTIK